MIRSVLSFLFTLVIVLFVYLLAPLLLIVIAAAILLVLGSLLTRVFPVTTFEATFIVVVVTLPLLWLYARLLSETGSLDSGFEAKAPPLASISIGRLITPRGRRGRK